MIKRKCAFCGAEILPYRGHRAIYCSEKCRCEARNVLEKLNPPASKHKQAEKNKRRILDFEREKLSCAGRTLAKSMENNDPWLISHGYGENDRFYTNADFVLGF